MCLSRLGATEALSCCATCGRLCETDCIIVSPRGQRSWSNYPWTNDPYWLTVFPGANFPSTLPVPYTSWACSCHQKMPSCGGAGSCHPIQSCLWVTAGVSTGNVGQALTVSATYCIRTSLTSTLLFPIIYLFICCCILGEIPSSLLQIINLIFYQV